jgi:hypothetical protein
MLISFRDFEISSIIVNIIRLSYNFDAYKLYYKYITVYLHHIFK